MFFIHSVIEKEYSKSPTSTSDNCATSAIPTSQELSTTIFQSLSEIGVTSPDLDFFKI